MQLSLKRGNLETAFRATSVARELLFQLGKIASRVTVLELHTDARSMTQAPS
jgi:hypothetical protein